MNVEQTSEVVAANPLRSLRPRSEIQGVRWYLQYELGIEVRKPWAQMDVQRIKSLQSALDLVEERR
jgi:hypothetical protein